MGHGVKKNVSITPLQAGIILLMVSTANGNSFVDRLHSIAEQAWEDEYIPDSGIPTIPLSEYDNFEVTGLFRAVTIEELEASITDGYPMPWLEEALKDESIPWEDRYWLDRRVRAAIAQNTHTFFNPAGSPVHIEADAVFPGELYWREHMIVDPAGFGASEDFERPMHLENTDIGYLLNAFGQRTGEIALAIPIAVSLSRDASIGVAVSGGSDIYHRDRQPYACFLSLDGSFEEIPLTNIGIYDAALASSGNIAVFSMTADFRSNTYVANDCHTDIEIFTGSGDFLCTVDTPSLDDTRAVSISQDGHFLCHKADGGNVCLVDCETGESTILEKPIWDQNTFRFRFSPNGSRLVLSGTTTDRIINMETNQQTILPFTALSNNTSAQSFDCSSDIGIVSSVAYIRSGDSYKRYLSLANNNIIFYSEELFISIHTYPLEAEFSPDGSFLLINPVDAAWGGPSVHVDSDSYNLPLIVFRITGR